MVGYSQKNVDSHGRYKYYSQHTKEHRRHKVNLATFRSGVMKGGKIFQNNETPGAITTKFVTLISNKQENNTV